MCAADPAFGATPSKESALSIMGLTEGAQAPDSCPCGNGTLRSGRASYRRRPGTAIMARMSLRVEGYPVASFGAEEAVSIVASVFDEVELERWDCVFLPLNTRGEVRAYCLHNFIPPQPAEEVDLPLWLTKRGMLVGARKAAELRPRLP